MNRCFGIFNSASIGDDFKNLSKNIYIGEQLIPKNFSNPKDEASYSTLKNAGILVELPGKVIGFSSPLAKRHYFEWLFPTLPSL
jgi:hypothetical protein